MHRLSIFAAVHTVCGEPLRPWLRVSNREKFVTCEKCKARRRAFRKSAKARAKILGVA